MVETKDTTIIMVRGDSANIPFEYPEYEYNEGDEFKFAVKKTDEDASPALVKKIPASTLTLHLNPEDTKPLEFGTYLYEVEYKSADGTIVDTFINSKKFKILAELD